MPLALRVAALVKSLTNNLGIYLHIPFCEKKCAYCDFYSTFPSKTVLDKFTDALKCSIKQWGGKIHRPIDTIYLGGGTPALLSHRLGCVIDTIKTNFSVSDDAEITLEINPSGNASELLKFAKTSGVNRLSIGVQSSNNETLSLLGRRHTKKDAEITIEKARELGFNNISLDLMIGLPSSDVDSLKKDLDFLLSQNPEHISAYILKIEENTAFYKMKNLDLPDDENISEQYLFMCEYLENNGYSHYEISNFAKKGCESCHNLKYWNCEEYLGIGPSAHSYLEEKRFFYPRDLKAFCEGNEPVFDSFGGDYEEVFMLALRLKKGINLKEFENKFNISFTQDFYNKCSLFEKEKLINISDNISLTNEGMLLSNTIITELLECIN